MRAKNIIKVDIKPFRRGAVSLYMSDESKSTLDRMARDLTGTEQGRSTTMDAMIGFCNANIVSFEAWFRGAK